MNLELELTYNKFYFHPFAQISSLFPSNEHITINHLK